MSGPFGSSQWMYSSGGFYDFPIEQSLKFNDDDSSYLSWTPASAGNRKTFTFSAWVKICDLATTHHRLFDTPSSNFGRIFATADDNGGNTIRVLIGDGTSNCDLVTNAKYRDTSAWYHIVVAIDTTQSVASNRAKLYVNGELVTDLNRSTYMNQNVDTAISSTTQHVIGGAGGQFFDGYLAEVNFIDGQALDATSFGEFKSGVWIPKDPSGLTYGTNGFRLSFQNDTVSEGFNTVTYTGNNAQRSITGVGFQPDLVWTKYRSAVGAHTLMDSVRGASARLFSNLTNAEAATNGLISFDADGFTMGDNATSHNMNASGETVVAWCWDAGSGSAASNTDGSITSTVKANPDYGMSIVTWTGTGVTGATVGHGLNSKPDLLIVKNRSTANRWLVYTDAIDGTYDFLELNSTAAAANSSLSLYTNSVFSVFGAADSNASGDNYVAYAFHSVTGYSKVGSYSGSGAAGNTITTGFKPAFVMIKRTDTTGDWLIADGTRSTSDPRNLYLKPNSSSAELDLQVTAGVDFVDFTDTGFVIQNSGGYDNASGGTYIYIAFADTRDNAFWRDQSGNGNDWQPNNLTYQDSLPDSTTNNFAVLNPLIKDTVLSEGNLRNNGNTANSITFATMGNSTGKWYYEFNYKTLGVPVVKIGVANADAAAELGSDTSGWAMIMHNDTSNGKPVHNNVVGTDYAEFASGDVVQVAYDIDSGKMWFGRNGTWLNSGDPAAGTNAIFTNLSGTIFPAFNIYNKGGSPTGEIIANFGQDSSFAGNKPAQGNTDANGIGDFYYAPPSGYLALCTANLPDPVIDPAQDDVPSDYFNTVLYTGSVSSVTGVGFQPDWTWIKQRSGPVRRHHLQDAVRGAGKSLFSNDTTAEETSVNYLTSFDADGFSLGGSSEVNGSGLTYVAWNWLAGNGTSSNTSGSISSTISVNQKAGFSILTYSGDGTTSSVGHGLSQTPELFIIKRRDAALNWYTYTTVVDGSMDVFFLNLNDAKVDSSLSAPTSSVLNIAGNLNLSGADYVSYVFHSVEGYSKFGSYTGNGSTDGPFVYTGFRPSFFLTKRTDSTSNWIITDNKRDTYNVPQNELYADLSSAEGIATRADFLSNGFKVRGIGAANNASGGTYIYMAFAEMPAKYSLGR